MYRQTDKAKAMMAAKLIADIDAAPILTSSMVRAATEATNSLCRWVELSDDLVEISTAMCLAIRHLANIERNARSVLSDPIIDDVLMALHCTTVSLKTATRRKIKPFNEQEEDVEEEFSVEEQSPGTQMPKDVQRSMEKASLHFYIIWFILMVLLLVGSAVMIIVHGFHFRHEVDQLEEDVTMSLALVAKKTLNFMYSAMVSANANIKEIGITTASTALTDISSRVYSAQEVVTRSDNYLTDYRGAVQDFSNSDQVTMVTTPRAYGGICQTNQTYPIHRINDIFTNQSYVVPLLTPNSCGNDALSTGVFSTVVPSYLGYNNFVTTYRRSSARLACFYHSGFGLSVAVTHDRKPLQEYLLPESTLIGKVSHFPGEEGLLVEQLALWLGLTIAASASVLFLLLTWMMSSKHPQWKVLFSLLIAGLMGIALMVVYFVSLLVFRSAQNNAILKTTASLMRGITGSVFSQYISENNMSWRMFAVLVDDLLTGELFATDLGATVVYPESMTNVAQTIDAARISKFRRGSFSGLQDGYAVSSSYERTTGWNFIIARKLPPKFHVDANIAVVLCVPVIAFFVVLGFMSWSPLNRLRFFGVGSPILRYRVDPIHIRYIFYALMVVLWIGGMVAVNCYGVSEVEKQLTKFSQDSLILLGGCLRGSGISDICVNHCGMPDFTTILYFRKTTVPGNEYPNADYIESSVPFPFPMQGSWTSHYLGAQLAINNIHTTLLNAPFFSTPVVNRTINVTDPRYVIRHMMSTTGINNSVGFAVERFPQSYYPTSFSFSTHSIGICIVVILSAIVITVCEMEYISLFQSASRNEKVPLRPYVYMGIAFSLLPLSFLLHGAVIKTVIRGEMLEFALQELSFLVSAVGYRLGIISLDMTNCTHEELLNKLTEVTLNSSVSAMVMGNVFFRIRIAHEVGQRGSGLVQINSVMEQQPLDLGPLDRGDIPTCGHFSAQYVSDHSAGIMNYCFVEISQSAALNTPRVFLLATTSIKLWVDDPTKEVWTQFIGVSAVVGVTLAVVLGLSLFFSLHTAHAFGYPVINTKEVFPFTEAIPQAFTKEYFMPRRQRMLWVASLLLLGVFLTYYCICTGQYIFLINESRRVAVVYESQSDLYVSVTSGAVCDAYNYILFPFPQNTIKKLMLLNNQAEAGTLPYQFVTDMGRETFCQGVTNTYLNLSDTHNILNSVLGAAKDGFGSYCSLIAERYDSLYISSQEKTFTAIDRLVSSVKSDLNGFVTVNFPATVTFFHQVSIVRDLLRKLYVLDHLAIVSYADFAPMTMSDENWPFSDDVDPIIRSTLSAASQLKTLVEKDLAKLKTDSVLASPSSKNTLEDLYNQIKEAYAGSYALQSLLASIWSTQLKRCAEAISLGNTTQTTIASQQQSEEIASIQFLSGNISMSLDYEMTTRKTFQLKENIKAGRPLNDELPTLTWQRWNSLKQIKRMYNVAFACTFCVFGILGCCALLHLKLMRRKTELVQDVLYRERVPLTSKRRASLRRSTDPVRHEDVSTQKLKGMEDSWTPSSLGKNDSIEEKHVEPPTADASSSRQNSTENNSSPTYSSLRTPLGKRLQRRVTLPVLVFLLLTLLPFVCSFWLLTLSHHVVDADLQNIGKVLSLYEKVQSIMETIENILENSVLFYLGKISESDLQTYMSSLQNKTIEFGSAYTWELQLQGSPEVDNMMRRFQQLKESLTAEVQAFNSIVSTSTMQTFYEPQSSYARSFLPGLTNSSTFGALLPMSITTDGSEMNTFSKALYTKVMEDMATSSTDAAKKRQIIAMYALVCASFDTASSAELTLWHATVAAARENGAAVAVTYGGFALLVNSDALSAIATAADPSGEAAAKAVTEHFKELMDLYGRSSQQRNLFTNTLTAPTDAASSPLGAYKAAGYVSSYLTATTTEGKFSNIFGYNRNLTSLSSSLHGKKTLVQRIEDYNEAVRDVFLSLGNGALRTFPSRTNSWIWYDELVLEPTATRDHKDLEYLNTATRWCCIVSFWGLVLTVFVSVYLMYLM